jgi:hypothetical protein
LTGFCVQIIWRFTKQYIARETFADFKVKVFGGNAAHRIFANTFASFRVEILGGEARLGHAVYALAVYRVPI